MKLLELLYFGTESQETCVLKYPEVHYSEICLCEACFTYVRKLQPAS